jgi:hypothetical protein
MFGPRREELTGGWRKIRNEKLHNLYASPNIVKAIKRKVDEMNDSCSTHGDIYIFFFLS